VQLVKSVACHDRYKNETKIFVFKLAVRKKGKTKATKLTSWRNSIGEVILQQTFDSVMATVKERGQGVSNTPWSAKLCVTLWLILIIVGIVCFGWHDMESVIQNVLQASLMAHEKLYSMLIPTFSGPCICAKMSYTVFCWFIIMCQEICCGIFSCSLSLSISLLLLLYSHSSLLTLSFPRKSVNKLIVTTKYNSF